MTNPTSPATLGEVVDGCICTFAQRLVGDGCAACNPQHDLTDDEEDEMERRCGKD